MLEQAQRGDTVVVYSLSRLSRGMNHLLELAERFERGGIALVSLTEQIDTSTAMGVFTFRLLAALAAMERDLLIERTQAGLARRGRKAWPRSRSGTRGCSLRVESAPTTSRSR
jgi:DNA invertase Pin-like site-specific DNA recombinase